MVTIVLFGGALAGAAVSSVRTPGAGWTGSAWTAAMSDPAFRDALVFSVRTAAIATVLSAVLAIPVAAIVRDRLWARIGLGVPILVPHLVIAVTAVLWLGSGGLADRMLDGLPAQLIRDRGGIGVVLVYVYKEVPFLALLAAAWTPQVRDRQEAAAVLGAGTLRQFSAVVWPAVRLPLVAGSLIVAAFVLGAFEVPLVVGPTYPPSLATLAYEHTQVAELAGQARAAAVLLVTAGLALLLALPAARAARHADG